MGDQKEMLPGGELPANTDVVDPAGGRSPEKKG